MRGEKWLDWAAYGTWLVVGLPTLAEIASGELGGSSAFAWMAAFIAFGVGLALCLPEPAGRPRAIARYAVVLIAQSVAGLAMVWFGRGGAEGATLVIVAAEVAAIFPQRVAWGWVAGQSIVLAALFALRNDSWIDALTAAGAFAGFQAFAIAAMSLARSEREARQQLGRANAELVAAQALLAENSRIAERLRISRDLHDTLGHHLTALSLQLDVASRLTSGQAAEHVQEAHAITRLLLGDVRDVVSQMRESSRTDLAQSLKALASRPGPLRIHLEMPATLPLDDLEQGHALLQSVQEIITNATRHGGARNLWIRIDHQADGIDLHARDDGRGAAELKWGNGLTGMRERFEEFSGRVEISPGAGRGFEVHGFMPRAAAAS